MYVDVEYWNDRINELNLSTKCRDLKSHIVQITQYLPSNSPLARRLWHIKHDMCYLPQCTTCSNVVRWNPQQKNYSKYCGVSCASSDPNKIAKSLAWKQDSARSRSATEKAVNTRKNTNQQRYGHTNYLASDTGKDIAIKGKIAKYGCNFRLREQQARQSTMRERYFTSSYLSVLNNNKISDASKEKLTDSGWLAEMIQRRLTPEEIGDMLCVNQQTVRNYMHYNGINSVYSNTSAGERQVADFVEPLVPIVRNTKSVISPFELDVYIPSHNLAIEYCGLYWHSEQQGKGRHYHEQKYKMCAHQGIQLLTIFEDEWKNRTQQVKNKISHLLGKSNNKHHARKLKICEVTTKQKREFFESNHIQGDGPGSVTYGLMTGKELIAAMTFIKQADNKYVLNRYATSAHVVGGFSKLLKHFKKTTNWTEIVSFADLRWSTGNLYEKTGFVLDEIIPPDYSYSPDGCARFHKFNYRRKNLPKLLKVFDPDLSESENCNANGVLRIWDCGKKRYLTTNPNR